MQSEALDYILEGLEAELELERELGVRTVELDRSLLTPLSVGQSSERQPSTIAREVGGRVAVAAVAAQTSKSSNQEVLDFVFLHDRPLSSAGIEMMAKIITAMGKTAETAPIVIEMPVPKAKVYVALGGLALRKFQPTLKGEPGQWLVSQGGSPLLVTYSPMYILRFPTVTPAVKKIKADMWQSLKTVLQRVRQL